jgi:hypothetical protein
MRMKKVAVKVPDYKSCGVPGNVVYLQEKQQQLWL